MQEVIHSGHTKKRRRFLSNVARWTVLDTEHLKFFANIAVEFAPVPLPFSPPFSPSHHAGGVCCPPQDTVPAETLTLANSKWKVHPRPPLLSLLSIPMMIA